MDKGYAQRAELRRQSWQGKKVSSHSAMREEDLTFWLQATPSARLDAAWQMALESWTLKGESGPAPRLQGSPIGIRRRES